MITPAYTKEIRFDRESGDFALFLDGQLVGFARSYADGETTLDQLVFELLGGALVSEVTR